MRIAICDDENIWINHIEEYIKKIKSIYNEIEYDVFISGESLLSHYNNEDIYDIVILDIEMNGMSGIDTSNAIRDKDPAVIIFFLTSYKEYVFECFRSSPMNFWVKPLKYEIFKEDIIRAHKSIEQSYTYLKIIDNRKRIRLKCSSIIYIENKERKSWIYNTNGIYKTNKLISELIKKLDEKIFVRVYKSFIINLKYVHIIGDNELSLYNSDEKIPISRTYKKELIDKYINLKEGEIV